jgi:UDP-N-acetyl-D-glucosamine/UDP-N-acetyl-D-galactosamine dehydrogenase
MKTQERSISVTGLGYVGLPVAIAFAKRQTVVGYDTSRARISELQQHHDRNNETSSQTLKDCHLKLTNDPNDLQQANFHIVATPTPINQAKHPDLSMLEAASEQIGRILKKDDIVVYESTVFPGATEEVCVPILEQHSGLTCGKDFFVGYSPERINPGDQKNQFESITKVVSGCDSNTLAIIAETYALVVTAGIHKAPSIKVAEAAKVIENTQRDLNIALINELAMIFKKMHIDTQDVLAAAQTKWNFLPFQPGLVGGHCIGVDPYYLTYKAQMLDCQPDIILAGRKTNDNMSRYIAEQVILEMIRLEIPIKQANIGVLGFTFKEDCNDVRNTKVADLVNNLKQYGTQVCVHDPIACANEVQQHYQTALSSWEQLPTLDVMVMAVKHQYYRDLDYAQIAEKLSPDALIVDIKNSLDMQKLRTFHPNLQCWRL